MAAALTAMRAAYARLGFENDAATMITDDQELDSVEELQILTDAEVENLCKVLRRPGGTISNPNAANQGQPAQIPNPGIQVSLRAENNLKLGCFYIRHCVRTSRACTPALLTMCYS